jgi:hypothetical protein
MPAVVVAACDPMIALTSQFVSCCTSASWNLVMSNDFTAAALAADRDLSNGVHRLLVSSSAWSMANARFSSNLTTDCTVA